MKFLLDNNLSPHFAAGLAGFAARDGDIVVHIRDRFPVDVADIEWMSALTAEGGWAVVTRDRLTRNPAERAVLRRGGLTAFILARGWASLRYWDEAWRLTRWWETIRTFAEHSVGVYEVPLKFSGGKLRQVNV